MTTETQTPTHKTIENRPDSDFNIRSLELTRQNVTVAGFLAYVHFKCRKAGIDWVQIDRNDFENPIDGRLASYNIKDGKKRCHYSDAPGKSFDQVFDADPDHPCQAEICKTYPLDQQTYFMNWNGECFNLIIEFTYDDEKRGHGYFYTADKSLKQGVQ